MNLDESTRSIAPGEFITLSDGFTHFQQIGHSDSTTVILVHGFSVPFYIWDPTFQALTDSGFHVIRYDLFGRGYSDRPDTEYSYTFFAKQLNELILSLKISKPVHLIGLSMGGAVVATYGNTYPTSVASITLIDPASITVESIGMLSWPFIGEYAMVFKALDMPDGQLTDFYRPENYPDWVSKYTTQMRYYGFRNAILSTLRNNHDTDYNLLYTLLSLKDIPIQLIWGVHDKTVPYSRSDDVRKMIPLAEFHPIKDAGHLPHLEQADSVNQILVKFLLSN